MKKIIVIASLLITANSFAASIECEKAIADVATTANMLGMAVANAAFNGRDIESDDAVISAQNFLKRASQVSLAVCK